uniref:C-type lectin domain-containing protein n=1 Tax=Periophthalmus magnuspinnatus TaxID=409849 RepID=A0A3B3ZV25_9GOBI
MDPRSARGCPGHVFWTLTWSGIFTVLTWISLGVHMEVSLRGGPWVFYRGAEYLLAKQPFSWDAVSLACQMMGAYLVSIHSKEELHFIKERLRRVCTFILGWVRVFVGYWLDLVNIPLHSGSYSLKKCAIFFMTILWRFSGIDQTLQVSCMYKYK